MGEPSVKTIARKGEMSRGLIKEWGRRGSTAGTACGGKCALQRRLTPLGSDQTFGKEKRLHADHHLNPRRMCLGFQQAFRVFDARSARKKGFVIPSSQRLPVTCPAKAMN